MHRTWTKVARRGLVEASVLTLSPHQAAEVSGSGIPLGYIRVLAATTNEAHVSMVTWTRCELENMRWADTRTAKSSWYLLGSAFTQRTCGTTQNRCLHQPRPGFADCAGVKVVDGLSWPWVIDEEIISYTVRCSWV